MGAAASTVAQTLRILMKEDATWLAHVDP
jgi:hypothetical protein